MGTVSTDEFWRVGRGLLASTALALGAAGCAIGGGPTSVDLTDDSLKTAAETAEQIQPSEITLANTNQPHTVRRMSELLELDREDIVSLSREELSYFKVDDLSDQDWVTLTHEIDSVDYKIDYGRNVKRLFSEGCRFVTHYEGYMSLYENQGNKYQMCLHSELNAECTIWGAPGGRQISRTALCENSEGFTWELPLHRKLAQHDPNAPRLCQLQTRQVLTNAECVPN